MRKPSRLADSHLSHRVDNTSVGQVSGIWAVGGVLVHNLSGVRDAAIVVGGGASREGDGCDG